MSNGILLFGRNDRMGLGSMTADFIRGMQPERVVVVDVNSRKGKIGLAHPKIQVTHRGQLADANFVNTLLVGIDVIVGFETWYHPQVPIIARQMHIKSVLFPMWEWSSAQDCGNSDVLLCLSETDYRKYWALPMPGVTRHRVDWPASPEIHDEGPLCCPKCKQPGATPSVSCPEDSRKCRCGNVFSVDSGVRLGRKVNWPPKTFVHVAGNASHNRDGTKEVLQAALHLEETGAILKVFANFDVSRWIVLKPWIQVCTPQQGRRELFGGCDCLVQPRRLGGHSLAINEAWGEGIPVITLDMPDWRGNPLTVRACPQPNEKFGPDFCPVWAANPEELGQFMRSIALGQIMRPIVPSVCTWESFRKFWQTQVTRESVT